MANGDGVEGAGGFTRYVTQSEFNHYCTQNDKDHEKIMCALFGPDGRNGIVHEINNISLQLKLIFGAVLFIQPVIITLVLRWIGM